MKKFTLTINLYSLSKVLLLAGIFIIPIITNAQDKQRPKSFIEIGGGFSSLFLSETDDLYGGGCFNSSFNFSVKDNLSIYLRVNTYSLASNNAYFENDIRQQYQQAGYQQGDYKFITSDYIYGRYSQSEFTTGVTTKHEFFKNFYGTTSLGLGFGISNYSGEKVTVLDYYDFQKYSYIRSSSQSAYFVAGVSIGVQWKFGDRIPFGIYARTDNSFVGISHFGLQDYVYYENKYYHKSMNSICTSFIGGIVIYI